MNRLDFPQEQETVEEGKSRRIHFSCFIALPSPEFLAHLTEEGRGGGPASSHHAAAPSQLPLSAPCSGAQGAHFPADKTHGHGAATAAGPSLHSPRPAPAGAPEP